MASQQPYYYAGSQPVVVQGQHVSAPVISASTYNHQGIQDVDSLAKGRPQPKRCNDAFFAILFYIQLGVMGWCAAVYGPLMYGDIADQYAGGQRYLSSLGRRFLQEDNNGEMDFSLETADILIILGLTGLLGLVISSLALGFMMSFAGMLIKTALIFNIVLYLLLGLLALATGQMPLVLMSLFAFAVSACYAYAVWRRIPFAAANLVTAITAVRANFGLSLFAYFSLLLTFLWSIWWSLAAVSVNFVANGCSADGECESEPNGIIVFLFLVSYFWTAQVIKNTVHVTVAGTVGTWWFVPIEASSFCSKAVCDSWVRSITYAFGSICFGSLIVAIIQATKEVLHQMRHQDDSILMCCAECLLGCIESLVEYFNQWAYVYVALYGYSFMDAGKNVMTLFRTRGWTSIIADMLVDAVLSMVALGVGVLTGLLGILVVKTRGVDLANGMGFGAFL